MTNWPKYRSHKIVQALPIVVIDETSGPNTVRVLFVDEPDGRIAFVPNVAAMLTRATVGDYAVIYDDNYRSISPKEAFESGYTEIKD